VGKDNAPVGGTSAIRRISSNHSERTDLLVCQSNRIQRLPSLVIQQSWGKRVRRKCERVGTAAPPATEPTARCISRALHEQPDEGRCKRWAQGTSVQFKSFYMMRCDVANARSSSLRCSVKGSSETGLAGGAAADGTITAGGGGATA
jgi:hypothetical protein